MERDSTFRAARSAYELGRNATQAEEPESWPRIKSSAADYYRAFQSFLEDRGATMAEFMNKRHVEGHSNVVLDAAGNGHPFLDREKSPHDGTLAIGLSDLRDTDEIKNQYNEARVDILPGNLLTRKTLGDVQRWLQQKKAIGFDLVFFRPGAGIKYIGVDTPDRAKLYEYSANRGVFGVLLKRVYDILAPNGEIFADIDIHPTEEQIREYEGYMDRLRAIGIKAEIAINGRQKWLTVHIVKAQTAPQLLPNIAFE